MSFPFSRTSDHNRRLVGDELREFDLAYRLTKHVRGGNTRQVDRMLADGASIDGSRFMEYRPLMLAAGKTDPHYILCMLAL